MSNNKFISLWCFVVLFCVVTCERGCPPPEDIIPCVCRDQGQYVDLICSNISDTEDLVRIFQNAQRYHFNKFTLEQSTLQYIPYTVFDDVEVKYMFFDAVTFMNTFNKIPNDPGLREFFLRRVHVLSGWDWKKLSAFDKLERLIMVDIPLKKLSTDFRPNISKKLKLLSMDWCQIKKFRDDEFVEFTDLEEFEVSHDQISIVKRSIFPRQNKLRHLALEYNKITSIPADLFTNMPKLTYVAFKGNLMSVLPENTFKPIMSYVRNLDFRMNPIKCDCLFVWLLQYRHLDLSGKCYAPKSLYERNFYSLTTDDFNC